MERQMKTFKDMTPAQRIAVMRHAGVVLFPNLSKEGKKNVLCIENEPVVSAQKSALKLAVN